ncbi:proline--tRNA ligase [Mycoplasmopsis opalescens]|uniref:proline--tRNA ligase n=1 Tax=Mycoplasmopsis opalescens TaxID=114886 RepID=UPI0004A7298E|nr:proline--tRNA ligase [Mycoplasmopsis opalescens]
MRNRELEKITPLEVDFARWYTDVVTAGNLIAYGPVKGTLMYKPNAYGIWELIQKNLDEIFKANGVKNVYMPIFIPESLFAKERDHIVGFNPELATVTMVGDKKLDEKIYIRPTSEVLFAEFFKNEIESHKDLPIIVNQWANVVRWEKTTNPFLRSREFLWQEGHTAHATAEEARETTTKMINIYQKFLRDYLAIPTIKGKKTHREKFAGATTTYTVEAMMKDGRALQSGTSHYLNQNFSRVYDIAFKNQDNKKTHVYQTSWGVSTRLLGAIIMSHGDNRGLIIPPKVAPNQVDIIEVFANKDPKVHECALQLVKTLSKKNRVRLDYSDKTPGFKASQSEIEGTPLRIEVGPRDVANGEVVLVRRDTLEKTIVKIEDVPKYVKQLLNEIHKNLYACAEKRLNDNIVHVDNYEDFKKAIAEQKFVYAPLCCGDIAEAKIKEETGATVRVIPRGSRTTKGAKCLYEDCTAETYRWVIFARAY